MAWRDRLRRRAAGTDTADRPPRTERSGAGAGGSSGEGPDPSAPGDWGSSAPGDPGPSVPGGWDGGWRRTPPPELTVSRAQLGVSDGLAFRAGLAAWQNPSFDAGLGHALLPTAPAGLVRGVTRPAAPQPTVTGGGPLLLRALRPEGADGPRDATPDAGATDGAAPASAVRTPHVARRTRPGARPSGPAPQDSSASGSAVSGSVASGTTPSGSGSSRSASPGPEPSAARPSRSGSGDNSTAGKGRSSDAPRSRGITSTDSPAVLSSTPSPVQRAVKPDTGPVVTPADSGRPSAAPDIPLVRRVSVVPGAAADAGGARPASAGPASETRSRAPQPNSGGRTSSGPAAQRSATGTTGLQPARGGRKSEASASGAEVSQAVVQPSPGPRLTVARRPAGPVRRVPALRPAATAAPENGTAPDTNGPAPAGTRAPSAAPVQRAATREGSRAPLGAPLSELPSTAAPLAEGTAASHPAPGTGAVSGPALPVVQRHAEGTVGTSGASDGGVRGTAHGAPDGPAAPADAPRRITGPARPGARARGGLGAPLSALPPSAGLPGSATSGARAFRVAPGPNVQRAPAPSTTDRERMPTEAAPRTAPFAREESGADAPLLGAGEGRRRLADDSSTGGSASTGPTDHGNGPATPLVTPSPAAVPHRPAPAGAAGAVGTEDSAGNARRPGATSGGHRPQEPAAPGPVVVARAVAQGTGGTGGTGGGRTAGAADRPPVTVPRSGGRRPQEPAAPGPVVVARAVAEGMGGTGGARTPGAAGRPPLTVTRSTAAPRTLSLLATRPLTLNTRVPQGVAPPAAARTGDRPVVAARWPGAPAAPQGDRAPATGVPARPAPGPSAVAPATPQVQRAATTHPGPENSGVRRTGSPGSVQRVPVVRPAPSHRETPGALAPAAAVPARSLPVTAPQAPPLTHGPSAMSAPAPAPVGAVPLVRPRTVSPGPGPAAGGRTGRAATPVQRDVTGAGDTALPRGVPAKEVPAHGRPRSASASSATPTASASASGKGAARRAESPQDPGPDLDDLARRLLDPVARLLRTELRRGRDRTGRPYDGRR
ncbi:hypothetical protein [Streptomyces sp. NBC_01615]|uniref:hypothetical protein n=1 Tax=Streptomyces sp. NBC_01615 TaxID=2975898 RepID=UPI00386583C8